MVKLENRYFSIGQICESGQCFRIQKIQDNRYAVIARGNYLELEEGDKETIFFCSEQEYETLWKNYFDLETDYKGYLDQIDWTDEYLQRAAAYGSGIRILQQDIWEMIISFIISQQNNIKRIRKCIETLSETYGEQKQTVDGRVYYVFPTAKALAGAGEEALRACNLGYRSKYIVNTARSVEDGEVDLSRLPGMQYTQAKEELMKLSGIGIKVADCICLFGLHHLNAFPVDTHINKVLQTRYPDGFPFPRYAGWEGVLQQYIFYYDLMKPDMV